MMRDIIELIHRRWLTDEVFELEFTRTEGFDFQPGQHIRFHHESIERDYTPISTSGDDGIRICVKRNASKMSDGDSFSTYLSICQIGEKFKISGPYGHFLYHPAKQLEDVFIGTGTGVAPFVAFTDSGVFADIMLQGARNSDQLIYRDLLSRQSHQYVPCFSDIGGGRSSAGFSGRVTDYLENRLSAGKYHFYLCGKREMILDAMEIIDDRFPDSRVFTERFT